MRGIKTNGKYKEKRKCFIITPIGESDSSIFRKAKGVIDSVIKPVLEETSMLKSKRIKCIIVIVLSLLSLFMITTIVRASAYSVLVADDFSHGNSVGAFHVDALTYIKASIQYAYKEYMTWQGTYFSMFLQALLSPINNGGIEQLRIVMVTNSILFFTSLIYFIFTFLDRNSIIIKMIFVTIILFMVTNYQAYEEVFYWFSGAVSYSIPLSLLMIAVSCAIKISYKHKMVYFILAIITGVMAVGGSLVVTGLGCYIILLICLYLYLRDKKVDVLRTAVCIIWLIGALINACAPGNFIRHGAIDETGVHPLKAIYDSFYIVDARCQTFFNSTNISILLIIVLICGIYIGRIMVINIHAYLPVSILALFAPIVVSFPMALGYSGQGIPNRCAFVIDIAIIFSLINTFCLVGIIIASKMSEKDLKIVYVMMISCTLIGCTIDQYGLSRIKTLNICYDLFSGTYRSHYENCINFYESLSEYEENAEVRISTNDMPYNIENFYNFYLSDDPENWVNVAVAHYYKLKSIAVYYE